VGEAKDGRVEEEVVTEAIQEVATGMHQAEAQEEVAISMVDAVDISNIHRKGRRRASRRSFLRNNKAMRKTLPLEPM
jgi:phage anti-repressor protein